MKQCYMTNDISLRDLLYIIDKGYEAIVKNPKSIESFKNLNKAHIEEFLYEVWKREKQGYYLMAFCDCTDDHVVGAVLLSTGSPWYNENVVCLNEECTVSFERGYGVTHTLAQYFISNLEDPDCEYNLVQASSANDCVAKLIENTYNKFGFKQYKSYYKTK